MKHRSLWVVALSWLCLVPIGTRAQSPARDTDARDMSLTYVAPRGPSARVTAVLLTGDGGWAELVKTLADGLAAHGIGVIGFNSRAWLSNPKTPDATAAAVVRALESVREQWPADRLLVVGYSRGADLAPFVVNRLPAPWRAKVVGVAMLGLAPMASFEFHWPDLVKDTPRATDIAILPELERLRGTPMLCVYGANEAVSGCRNAPDGLVRKDERRGGHHFDGDPDALVQSILKLLERTPAL